MADFPALAEYSVQMMTETFRWFGPDDPVSLADIKQCGCTGVMTSLHHIAYGEPWPREAIGKRKAELAEHGLEWSAVESVPVSEAIKTRTGDYERHIENYKTSLRNLGAEGIETVIYNFMPVLDWVRTDMAFPLDDGTQSMHFDPVRFAAFELHLLKRKGAENDYSPEQIQQAEQFFETLNADERKVFERRIVDVFPGMDFDFTLQDVRDMLSRYDSIDRKQLQQHLNLFLQDVLPVCEEAGVRLAIHPDDPPYSILGLPRIVSCETDIQSIMGMHDSPANGLCFCTGSYSSRGDNDLPKMINHWGHRINAIHLRSTQRNPDGSFYEANHLEGSMDMYAVVKALLTEIQKRKETGRADWQLAFRPDHGHTMLDDLKKPLTPTPGYSCIGRLRGLAEIRGLQTAISRAIPEHPNRNSTPC
jgi:mannonate dehydratase